MKKYLVTLVIMLAFAGSLHAVIGWSGNIWPNSYTDQTNGFDIIKSGKMELQISPEEETVFRQRYTTKLNPKLPSQQKQ